ncbi:SDR family NAD(P)-dependent oxidoreductase [Pontibacter beigongshangensis]|uniref:SDR family NAD(P)-dependent oxidoreductase n=1 Tax=Pontibacter beigongshangensis TaxID=2574733 RepID=UPI0016506EC5|nr:SDR family oxidoreductase [Pontibacter beigongshangensis]
MKYTALITGASGGIGYQLAKLFAKDGHNLVLVARSEDKLQQMALQFAIKYKIYTKVIAQDLAKPEAPQLIFDELKREGLQLDILVNNAGFANYGYFRETDVQKELAMMQVNMLALTHLTKLFLAQIRTDRPAKVLNIASTAAFPPGPLMAVYYATKAYVLSFSEALAAEQEGTNVSITVLCPGATATDFKERANLDGSGIFRDSLLADANDVAKAGYEGMMAGEVLVFPSLKDKLTAFSVRLAPRRLVRKLVKVIQEKR